MITLRKSVKKSLRHALLASSLVVGLAQAAHAETLQGRVALVINGDTFTINEASSGSTRVIRLYGIDAPELDQDWGREAKADLKRLLPREREVSIDVKSSAIRGPIVGVVRSSGVNINQEQLRRGNAWVVRSENFSPTDKAIETKARAGEKGLWHSLAAIAPWNWRSGER